MIRLLIALVLVASPVAAHELQPAFLELREGAGSGIDVTWKVPFYKGKPLPIEPAFPETWSRLTEPHLTPLGNGYLSRWKVDPAGAGLDGAAIAIEGPRTGLTDVLVRAQLADGSSLTRVLRPEEPATVLRFGEDGSPLLWDYIVIGVEHILLGYDHLLFVLCLVLIVRDRWLLVKTITAFTVAHSITLAAATLGWVDVPGAPVEAVIALSIVFLARELAVRHAEDRPGLTERYPWLVALSFGLLHGLGFAGALSDVGLPEDQIPLALLNFNIGVELGQLAFVALMLLVMAASKKLSPRLGQVALKPVVYATGIIAAYWCVERISGFWSVAA